MIPGSVDRIWCMPKVPFIMGTTSGTDSSYFLMSSSHTQKYFIYLGSTQGSYSGVDRRIINPFDSTAGPMWCTYPVRLLRRSCLNPTQECTVACLLFLPKWKDCTSLLSLQLRFYAKSACVTISSSLRGANYSGGFANPQSFGMFFFF